MILCASSKTPILLQRCCENQEAASCTEPLRRAPNRNFQHLCSNIVIFRDAANVVLLNMLQRNHDFAPHASGSHTLQAGEKATVYCENVVLAAARSMPLYAMSFKLEPQACFEGYMFVVSLVLFFLIFAVCRRRRRSNSRDDFRCRCGGAIAATTHIEPAVPFQRTINCFPIL